MGHKCKIGDFEQTAVECLTDINLKKIAHFLYIETYFYTDAHTCNFYFLSEHHISVPTSQSESDYVILIWRMMGWEIHINSATI